MKQVAALVLALGISSSSWGLSVAPGRTEIRLAPGQSIKTFLAVKNDAAEKVLVDVSTKDWFVLEANQAFPVQKWLNLHGKKQFVLNPGEERQVAVTAKSPKAATGELVGMVSFAYRREEPGMVTPMISVSVYVAVDGTEKVSGEIKEVVVRRWQDKLQMVALVRSTGNVHLRPTGTIRVFDNRNMEVLNAPIRVGDPAYPGTDRGYFCVPQEWTFKPGRYQVMADLSYRDVVMKQSRAFTVLKDGEIRMEDSL